MLIWSFELPWAVVADMGQPTVRRWIGIFLGVPGLRVLALNNLLPVEMLYGRLLTSHCGASLVIENKVGYGTYLRTQIATGFRIVASDERFPTAWVRAEAKEIDLTMLGYGGLSDILVTVAERLFVDHDLIAQVLCPMQIFPFQINRFVPVLRGAKRLLVIEEGQGYAGFGAEVIAQLTTCYPELCGKTRRVMPPCDIIPSSGTMEAAMLRRLHPLLRRLLLFANEKRAVRSDC